VQFNPNILEIGKMSEAPFIGWQLPDKNRVFGM
jgi:hypothetical protein